MTDTSCSRWNAMSVDEFAVLQGTMGQKLEKVDGVWWRRVRPFFYRPLLPYRELKAGSVAYPSRSTIGGVQHLVPQTAPANSRMDFLFFENPSEYSLNSMTQSCRRRIRHALRKFSVRPITDVNEFITTAHPVYLSFYERTKYGYKSERSDPQKFADWSHYLFNFPKVQILGAYDQSQLKSVSISYAVEDIVYLTSFFSQTDALSDFVSDLVLHAVRERAAMSQNITLIFASMGLRPRGLDEFYLLRGARRVSKPAWLKVNPLAMLLLKISGKDRYLSSQAALEAPRTSGQ